MLFPRVLDLPQKELRVKRCKRCDRLLEAWRRKTTSGTITLYPLVNLPVAHRPTPDKELHGMEPQVDPPVTPLTFLLTTLSKLEFELVLNSNLNHGFLLPSNLREGLTENLQTY